MSFDFVPIETSSPVSVSSTCTATSSINTLSASFIANGLQLELHAIKNASQKKSDLLVKKNKNRRAKHLTEKNKNLQKLCKHIMSIEFSLTYGLAVIMKYPRILELCKRKTNFIFFCFFFSKLALSYVYIKGLLNSTIDFDTVFKAWRTKKIWIRFNTTTMSFFTVSKDNVISQPSYSTHGDIEDINKYCWRSILENPKEFTVPFEETAWTVTKIVGRQVINAKVKYLIVWKSLNGRVFSE
jgi:hypothetical protein